MGALIRDVQILFSIFLHFGVNLPHFCIFEFCLFLHGFDPEKGGFPGFFRSTSRSEKLRKNFRKFGRETVTCREREMKMCRTQSSCENFRSTSRSEKLCTNFRNFGRETCREREMKLCCHGNERIFSAVWLKKIEFFRKF